MILLFNPDSAWLTVRRERGSIPPMQGDPRAKSESDFWRQLMRRLNYAPTALNALPAERFIYPNLIDADERLSRARIENPWIKKDMVKDGHMTGSHYYIRRAKGFRLQRDSRGDVISIEQVTGSKHCVKGAPCMIHDGNYAIRAVHLDYNAYETITLKVERF